MMMKVVDLFCGCGGLSLGFEKAGFEVVSGLDNWEEALNVYQLNFHHPAYKCDLIDVGDAVSIIGKYSPEMIIGGPPCQDYSSAGTRNEEGGRAVLTVKFAEIVTKIKPTWFVMENVSNIIKYKKVFEAMDLFHKNGYGLSYAVLNAAQCGVPQRRKRFFMVGKLYEKDDFFNPYFFRGQSSKEMTVRDYFGESLGIEAYYRHPRSYARRGIFSIDEPSPTIRGVNRPMPKGYKLHSNDPVKSLEDIRPLTTLERAAIQTFPGDFHWAGTKTDIEQMMGNAVPVNLAEFVGNAIKLYIADNSNNNTALIKVENVDTDFTRRGRIVAYGQQ